MKPAGFLSANPKREREHIMVVQRETRGENRGNINNCNYQPASDLCMDP